VKLRTEVFYSIDPLTGHRSLLGCRMEWTDLANQTMCTGDLSVRDMLEGGWRHMLRFARRIRQRLRELPRS
jgi:hypothetical protein